MSLEDLGAVRGTHIQELDQIFPRSHRDVLLQASGIVDIEEAPSTTSVAMDGFEPFVTWIFHELIN